MIPRRLALAGLALAAAASAAEPEVIASSAGPFHEARDGSGGAGRDARRPAYLGPVVNGVPGEPILVLLQGSDVLVRLEDLAALGLAPLGGELSRGDGGGVLVALSSLAPALRFEVDEEALALRLTAGAGLLGRRALDLGLARPADLVDEAAAAAFLNYAARAGTSGSTTGSAELGFSRGGWLALGAGSLREDGEVVRGLSSISREWRRGLVRATAGDLPLAPEPLGAAGVVGGFTVERDLDMDPYLVRAPLPRVSAFASTPSTLEVWLNGTLVRSEPVAPGTYDLSNVPVTAGQNDLRVVVRDAFGRTETLSASRYQAQGLLAPGLHVWGWSAGALRRGFGLESFDYGPPALLGRHRLGLTDALTAGARVEVTPDLASGGLSLVAGLPVGSVQAAGAVSVRGGRAGGAGLVAWRSSAGRGAFGVDFALTSPEYVTAQPFLGERPRWRAGADGTLVVTRLLTTRAGASVSGYAGREVRGALDGSASVRLSSRLFLQVGGRATLDTEERPELTGFATLMFAAAPGTSADASTEARRGAVSGNAGVQRALPPGEGVGYRVRAGGTTQPGGDDLSALVQAHTSFGRYEAEYSRLGEADGAAASAAGALVLVDRKLFATRPVTQSFAVVEVPGVAGVRVRANEQPAGRTDKDGALLLPSLIPYYASRVRIEAADVPLDRAIGATERIVAPPRRGGARVSFEAPSLAAVRGKVHVCPGGGAAAVPAYGTLAVEVGETLRTSPISGDGEFWVEGIPAGSHRARILWHGLACTFSLSVPEGAPPVLDAGELGCATECADAPPGGGPPVTAASAGGAGETAGAPPDAAGAPD